MADRDLNTMPVRDLIAEMREEVKGHPEEIVRQLVLMALTNRIEEQADRADAAQKEEKHWRHECRLETDKINEAILLMEPLETLALVFEKADDGSPIATIQMDLLRQFVASIKALSEKLRG